MAEPFDTLYQNMCLTPPNGKQFPVGKWHWNVKLSNSGEAFYIGDDDEHITILKNVQGFHHTIRADAKRPQHMTPRTLGQIIEHIEFNTTPNSSSPYQKDEILVQLKYIQKQFNIG